MLEEVEEIVIQKRQAAIKLAKNLEPFNPKLGQEFDAVYIETLTEEIKQLAREIKKLAKVVALLDTEETGFLSIKVDGEEERVTKLMRRYTTRIQKMADLIYETAYIDFEGLEQDEIREMMKVDEEGDEDDDNED
jgi:ribosomal protein S6